MNQHARRVRFRMWLNCPHDLTSDAVERFRLQRVRAIPSRALKRHCRLLRVVQLPPPSKHSVGYRHRASCSHRLCRVHDGHHQPCHVVHMLTIRPLSAFVPFGLIIGFEPLDQFSRRRRFKLVECTRRDFEQCVVASPERSTLHRFDVQPLTARPIANAQGQILAQRPLLGPLTFLFRRP